MRVGSLCCHRLGVRAPHVSTSTSSPRLLSPHRLFPAARLCIGSFSTSSSPVFLPMTDGGRGGQKRRWNGATLKSSSPSPSTDSRSRQLTLQESGLLEQQREPGMQPLDDDIEDVSDDEKTTTAAAPHSSSTPAAPRPTASSRLRRSPSPSASPSPAVPRHDAELRRFDLTVGNDNAFLLYAEQRARSIPFAQSQLALATLCAFRHTHVSSMPFSSAVQ